MTVLASLRMFFAGTEVTRKYTGSRPLMGCEDLESWGCEAMNHTLPSGSAATKAFHALKLPTLVCATAIAHEPSTAAAALVRMRGFMVLYRPAVTRLVLLRQAFVKLR